MLVTFLDQILGATSWEAAKRDPVVTIQLNTHFVSAARAGEFMEARGEAVRTTFFVYDSLGNTVNIDLTFVLESRGNTGTTWRYYAESADDSDIALDVTGQRRSVHVIDPSVCVRCGICMQVCNFNAIAVK